MENQQLSKKNQTSIVRYDLVPQRGLNEVNKILTSKLDNHEINEWRSNLKWSDALSILKKHLSEFELGNDYDENGLLNIAHVASQALLIAEMYTCFPQGDDRVLGATHVSVIGLDLDDTVFDFLGAYQKRFGVTLSDYWNGDYNMKDNLNELMNDKDFWVNLPVKNTPPIEVDYYVTARSIPIEWTMEAIQKNNLPKAKVYSIPWNESKIDTLKQLGITVFVDDKFQTFKECLNSGIFCYLVDSMHNRHYDVGHHRIMSLEPLKYLK